MELQPETVDTRPREGQQYSRIAAQPTAGKDRPETNLFVGLVSFRTRCALTLRE